MWSFFVKAPKFTMVLIFALVLFGIYSIFAIDKESNPDVEIPFVIVSTPFPGANAIDVERFVTDKLEDPILALENIKKVTSSSNLGFSSIAIEFEIGTDIDKSIRDIENAIELRKGDLPSDIGDTRVQQVDFNDTPIKVYTISGPFDLRQLRNFADELANRLERISGLSEARVIGGQEREIRVLIDNIKLAQFGVSFNEVINAISQANSNIPIGEIERDGQRYSLRFEGIVDEIEVLENIAVRTGNQPVFVRNIAKIENDYAELRNISLFGVNDDIQSAISIAIFKRAGGSILNVVDEADSIFEQAFEDLLPNGTIIEVTDDMADYIRTDLKNLSISGLQTTLIVIILIFLLLGWRESLLAGLSIPLTFLITFIFLENLGYTLNFLSLFSLILALGILVDAAIVMTEAVYENSKKGLSSRESALKAIEEFKTPLISGTLTTVFAFLPMLLTSGIIGEFIKSIPVTVSIVLFSALFVALAIIPTFFMILLDFTNSKKQTIFTKNKFRIFILFSLLFVNTIFAYLFLIIIFTGTFLPQAIFDQLKKYRIRLFDRISEKFEQFKQKRDSIVEKVWIIYRDILTKYIESKKLQRRFFASLGLAFIASLALPATGLLKVDMFPATDMDRIYIDLKLPTGSILQDTEEKILEITKYISEFDEVKSYLVNIGSGSTLGGGNGTHIGSLTLNLVEGKRRDSRELLEILDRELNSLIPGADIIVQQMGSGPEQGFPVAITIKGEDLDTLDIIATDIVNRIENLESTRAVSTSIIESPGEIVFSADRQNLAVYGVNITQLALLMRGAVFGQEVTTIRIDNEDIDVIAYLDIAQNNRAEISLESLQALQVQTLQGTMSLGSLVEVDFKPNRTSINREDGDRVITVTSGVRDGFVVQDVFAEVENALSDLAIPENYNINIGGQNEDTDESFADLGRAMIIGIFMIAALLIWQFNSFRQPLMVITSIPLALIGVLPGLFLINQPLSFPGMIGVVALAGIVVNNGIILIDQINQNRLNGALRKISVIEGGVSRLRPILLTTITTVAGLLPLVITQPSWAPLGFAIIFGLLFSTISTLMVVPLLYFKFAEEK